MTMKVCGVYLTPKQHKSIMKKAKECGITGQSALSKYIQKLADEDFMFVNKAETDLLKCIEKARKSKS